MKILSIKFLNFRTFLEEEIIFDEKLSLIYWKNWAWKSSITDAIWICLFWTSWSAFSRGSKEEEKNFLASKDAPCKLELAFEFMWDNYRIVRVLDSWKWDNNSFIIDKKPATVYKWNDKVTTEKVDDFIENLLWFSRQTFTKTVFSSQKDIEILSSWTLESKRKLIDNILNLWKLDELFFKYKSFLKDLISRKKFIEETNELVDIDAIKSEKHRLEKEINNHKKLLLNLEKENKSFIEKSQKIIKDFEEYSAKKQIFNKKNTDLNIEKNNLENYKKSLLENNKNLEKIFELEGYYKKNISIFDELKSISDDIENEKKNKVLFDKKNEILSKNKTLEQSIKNLSNENISILDDFNLIKYDELIKLKEDKNTFFLASKDKILSLAQEIWTIESNWKNKWEEVKKLENDLILIKQMDERAKCPTCFRELWNEFSNFIKNKDNELLELKKQHQNLRKLWFTKDSDLSKLKEESKELDTFLQKISNTLAKIEKNNSNIDVFSVQINENLTILSEIWEISFSSENYENLIKKQDKISLEKDKLTTIKWKIDNKSNIEKQINSLENSLSFSKNTIKTLEKEIIDINYSEEKFNEIQFSHLSFIEKSNTQKDDINNKKDEINLIDKSIDSLKFQEKTYEENYKKTKEINKNMLELESKKDIISDYKIYLFSVLKPRIEDIASNYFHKITYWKYSQIELSDSYEVFIDKKNIKFYSWWERDLANLCLRLSLSENLSLMHSWNSIDFLVLDEVLWSQDEERRELILTSLWELESKFSQILLISHTESVREFAKNLYEIKPVWEYKSKIIKN